MNLDADVLLRKFVFDDMTVLYFFFHIQILITNHWDSFVSSLFHMPSQMDQRIWVRPSDHRPVSLTGVWKTKQNHENRANNLS